MARSSKHGNKKNKPSHVRYMSRDQRTVNKERRILKCGGQKFLDKWRKDLPAWKARRKIKTA